MEKAFKLDFINDKTGSLYVNCCGCSQTEALHSFGPASKPHYLIHYVLSGKGHFRFHDKEYRLEAGYGFLIQPNELAFYQADAKDPWSYLWVGFAGSARKSIYIVWDCQTGILFFPVINQRSCIRLSVI